MRLEHRHYLTSRPHHFLLLYPVNTHNLHSVAWLDCIDILVVSDDRNSVWSLTLRDVLRKFLEFNELLICELAKVVYYLVTVLCKTLFTCCWLLDFSVLKDYSDIIFTLCTSERCSLHFRYDIRSPDYDPSK